MKLDGNAYCQFQIGRKANHELEDFSQKFPSVYIFGDEEHEENIKRGTNKFKFSYRLPNEIPYSVESYNGHVRHRIVAILEVACGFDLRAEKKINIGSRFDLSQVPGLIYPMDFKETKSFCFLLCQSGPLVMKLHLPEQGFALGEKIPITVDLENKSSANISQTEFSLIRTDTFSSNIHQRVEQKIVASDSSHGVRSRKTTSFLVFFKIPQDILTTSRFCKVYKISYEIKFTAKVDGFHFSPNIFVPVVIGDFRNSEIDYEKF